jgi:hypothetical protein
MDRDVRVVVPRPVYVRRNGQDLWIGVSRDLLITTLGFVGSFDELAVHAYRAGTD